MKRSQCHRYCTHRPMRTAIILAAVVLFMTVATKDITIVNAHSSTPEMKSKGQGTVRSTMRRRLHAASFHNRLWVCWRKKFTNNASVIHSLLFSRYLSPWYLLVLLQPNKKVLHRSRLPRPSSISPATSKLESCYQYLLESDTNKNGSLSRDEYMVFVDRVQSSVLSEISVASQKPNMRQNHHFSPHQQQLASPINSNMSNNLESIMVFNHISYHTTNMKNQKSVGNNSGLSSCEVNSHGEVECTRTADSQIESESHIWFGVGDISSNGSTKPSSSTADTMTQSPTMRGGLRRSKYANRIRQQEEQSMRNEYVHSICTELLIVLDYRYSELYSL